MMHQRLEFFLDLEILFDILFIVLCYAYLLPTVMALSFSSLIFTECNRLKTFVTYHFNYSKVCISSQSFWHKRTTFLYVVLAFRACKKKNAVTMTVELHWTRKRILEFTSQARRRSSHKWVVRVDFTIRPLSCIIDRLITTCTSGKNIRCIKGICTFSKRHAVTAIYVCMPNNKGTIFFPNALHKIYFLFRNARSFTNTGRHYFKGRKA